MRLASQGMQDLPRHVQHLAAVATLHLGCGSLRMAHEECMRTDRLAVGVIVPRTIVHSPAGLDSHVTGCITIWTWSERVQLCRCTVVFLAPSK